MNVYFLKEDISQYVIYPIPADESRYFIYNAESEEELAQKTPVLFEGQFALVEKQPTPEHEWNGTEWVISPEKLTAIIAQRKEQLLSTLANKADALKSGLLVGYPQTEIESFYRQEKEALAWKIDAKTETPMLSMIAKMRGVPFEILVEKVIEKANQLALAIGVIIGQRQKFEDALIAATTPEQLDEIEKGIDTWKFQTN